MNNKLMGRYELRAYRLFVFVGFILIALFALTWFNPSNISWLFDGPWAFLNILLFAVTTYVVWHEIIASAHVATLLVKMRKWQSRRPQKNLKVAFITTFVPGKEPHDMLRKSLTAIVAADYEHDTWVLDEGNDPEAKRICKELGVKHFSRNGIAKYNTASGAFAAKTKGGNHNAWYDAQGYKYDIVAQVDVDFIVKKNFLTETLGQFRDPRVAFVGTPQYYGNYNDGLVAKGAAEQTFSFYGPVQRGLDGAGNIPMMIGANHIVRVQALKEVGWYAGHLTEDLLTGMTLYAHGWKAVYCPKVLAVGEGPSTWDAFFAQQMRWAHGCYDVLFRHSNKLFRKMGIVQQLRLFVMLQHYFTGMNLVLGSVLLLLYFVFGVSTTNYPMDQALVLYFPILAWLFILPLWHHRFNINPKKEKGLLAAGKIATLAVQPVYFVALIGALRNKKVHFIVTPKGETTSDAVSFRLFWPHVVLGSISLLGLVYGLLEGRSSFILIFWAAANIVVTLLFVTLYALSKYAGKRTSLGW